ncbi:MAG: hypothetical protein QY310_11180 [Candidatus Jettenia sp. CY-1]|nr:MAG: hypothetical protein QY310_11180 [Candidatus Jettenia sp. CY-1]
MPDKNIRDIASRLVYRDFMTAGILIHRLKVKNTTKHRTMDNIIPDKLNIWKRLITYSLLAEMVCIVTTIRVIQ